MQFAKVAALEEAFLKREIDKTVSPQDHMFTPGPDWYFSVGVDAIRVIFRALAMSSLGEVRRILDLPCGHGRVARHLRAAFPRAAITFADIETDGVDFCTRQFGGAGVYSRPDLAEVGLGTGFDLIWIGSLFTPVGRGPPARWTGHPGG